MTSTGSNRTTPSNNSGTNSGAFHSMSAPATTNSGSSSPYSPIHPLGQVSGVGGNGEQMTMSPFSISKHRSIGRTSSGDSIGNVSGGGGLFSPPESPYSARLTKTPPFEMELLREKIQHLGWIGSPNQSGSKGRARSNSMAIGSPGSVAFLHNQLEEVSRQLDEKEKDVQLAAEIGKMLLEKNNDLESQVNQYSDLEKSYAQQLSQIDFLKSQNETLNLNLKEATLLNDLLEEKVADSLSMLSKMKSQQSKSSKKKHGRGGVDQGDIDLLNHEIEELKSKDLLKEKSFIKLKCEHDMLINKYEKIEIDYESNMDRLKEMELLKEKYNNIVSKNSSLLTIAKDISTRRSIIEEFNLIKDHFEETLENILTTTSTFTSEQQFDKDQELNILNNAKDIIEKLSLEQSTLPIVIQLVNLLKNFEQEEKELLRLKEQSNTLSRKSEQYDEEDDSLLDHIHSDSSDSEDSMTSYLKDQEDLQNDISSQNLKRSSILLLIALYSSSKHKDISEKFNKNILSITELQEDIKELNEKLVSNNKLNAKLELDGLNRIQELESKLIQSEEQVDQLKNSIQQLQDDLVSLQSDKEFDLNQQITIKDQLKDIQNQYNRLKEQYEQLKDENNNLHNRGKEFEFELETKKKNINDLNADLERLKQESIISQENASTKSEQATREYLTLIQELKQLIKDLEENLKQEKENSSKFNQELIIIKEMLEKEKQDGINLREKEINYLKETESLKGERNSLMEQLQVEKQDNIKQREKEVEYIKETESLKGERNILMQQLQAEKQENIKFREKEVDYLKEIEHLKSSLSLIEAEKNNLTDQLKQLQIEHQLYCKELISKHQLELEEIKFEECIVCNDKQIEISRLIKNLEEKELTFIQEIERLKVQTCQLCLEKDGLLEGRLSEIGQLKLELDKLGNQSCRSCLEKDRHLDKNREEIKQYKLELDQLRNQSCKTCLDRDQILNYNLKEINQLKMEMEQFRNQTCKTCLEKDQQLKENREEINRLKEENARLLSQLQQIGVKLAYEEQEKTKLIDAHKLKIDEIEREKVIAIAECSRNSTPRDLNANHTCIDGSLNGREWEMVKHVLTILPNTVLSTNCKYCTINQLLNGKIFCNILNYYINDCIDSRALHNDDNNITQSISHNKENLTLISSTLKLFGGYTSFQVDDIMFNDIALFKLLFEILYVGILHTINLEKHPELAFLWKHNPIPSISHEKEKWENFVRLDPSIFIKRWYNHFLKKDQNIVHNDFTKLNELKVWNSIMKQIYPESGFTLQTPIEEIMDYIKNVLKCPQIVTTLDLQSESDEHKAIFLMAMLFEMKPGIQMTEDMLVLSPELPNHDTQSSEEKAAKIWLKTVDISASSLDDFRDGLLLLRALDQISPGIVNWKKVNMTPSNTFSMTENCNYCVKLGREDLKFSLVGIAGKDFVDCHKKYLLSFVWQMMRYSCMKKVSLKGKDGKEITESDLVQWTNHRVQQISVKMNKPPISIKGFSDNLIRDGIFLLDLLESIQGGCIDYKLVEHSESEDARKSNAKYVISVARRLGSTAIIFWEDIVQAKSNMIMLFILDLMSLTLNHH